MKRATKRRTSICRQLTYQVGGEWTYNRSKQEWFEARSGRYAYYVHTGGFDINGEAAPGCALSVREPAGREVRRFKPV